MLSHAKNPKHIHCGKLFNNEIQTVEENFTKQNAIVDVTKVAQIQRLVNTFYRMVKSNTQFENLCVLQVENGADLGEKYSSDKALGEFLTLLHSENICHVATLIQASPFLSLGGDSTTDAYKISQEGGVARIIDMESSVPNRTVFGL